MTKFLPYGHQYIDEDDINAVIRVLKADYIAQGPEVAEMESTICRETGAKFCVVVSSGTAALHLAVKALNLSENAEGITTPITFLATANCMVYNNLIPVFADIDSKTYCINPVEIEKKITDSTKLIVPVDFAGQPVDAKAIRKIADKYDLYIIEDAAHAIGSIYSDGSKVGSCKYSDMTVFSFHPVKTITTGEGGAITTNNEQLYNALVLLRSHGMIREPVQISNYPGPWYYEMIKLGYNYRLTDIQAALGNSQLKKLDKFKNRRRVIVNKYNKAFAPLGNITIPYEMSGVDSCFHLYVLLIDFLKIGKTRSQVIEKVNELGVGVQVHYIPITRQPYFIEKFNTNAADFPIAENYYERALSIPLYPGMSDHDVDHVIDVIKQVVSS